jgi:hypothetical protein
MVARQFFNMSKLEGGKKLVASSYTFASTRKGDFLEGPT